MPRPPSPITDETQLIRFREAVRLLGGQRAAARALGASDRTIRGLCAGERPLHDGFLRDTAAALISHADKCRLLERGLSPAFAANLTEDQAERRGKPDARRFDQRSTIVRVRNPASICQACGRAQREGHATRCPNRREPWPTIEAEMADG